MSQITDLRKSVPMSEINSDIRIRTYRSADLSSVIELWRACGLVVPQNDPELDIKHKLSLQPELFLVATYLNRLVATVMAGYEGHRGWINYLAVDPDLQRKGIGRQIMTAAEKKLLDMGCPKINLQVRDSNQSVIAFYKRLGFNVDPVVSLGKRLEK